MNATLDAVRREGTWEERIAATAPERPYSCSALRGR